MVVVFPAPLGPRNPKISPGSTSKSKPFTARLRRLHSPRRNSLVSPTIRMGFIAASDTRTLSTAPSSHCSARTVSGDRTRNVRRTARGGVRAGGLAPPDLPAVEALAYRVSGTAWWLPRGVGDPAPPPLL